MVPWRWRLPEYSFSCAWKPATRSPADGVVRLPEGPGLGLEPDWDKVEHFTRQ